jgi:hypothetical protein
MDPNGIKNNIMMSSIHILLIREIPHYRYQKGMILDIGYWTISNQQYCKLARLGVEVMVMFHNTRKISTFEKKL